MLRGTSSIWKIWTTLALAPTDAAPAGDQVDDDQQEGRADQRGDEGPEEPGNLDVEDQVHQESEQQTANDADGDVSEAPKAITLYDPVGDGSCDATGDDPHDHGPDIAEN